MLRGINYDTGTRYGRGPLSRVRWEHAEMERELDAIRDELHCDAVARIARLSQGKADSARVERRLNAFLAKTAAIARARFGGPIGYAAVHREPVDWRPFDVVGIDWYGPVGDEDDDPAPTLRRLRDWGRPILVCEFGCCGFRGAAARGGMAWDVVDHTAGRPEIPPEIVRSEREQADRIAALQQAFERERLLGACVFTFAEYAMPHSPITRYDLDVASYGVVKVIREDYDDDASPYRWEPKLAFDAIAQHNRRARRAARRPLDFKRT